MSGPPPRNTLLRSASLLERKLSTGEKSLLIRGLLLPGYFHSLFNCIFKFSYISWTLSLYHICSPENLSFRTRTRSIGDVAISSIHVHLQICPRSQIGNSENKKEKPPEIVGDIVRWVFSYGSYCNSYKSFSNCSDRYLRAVTSDD